MKYYTVKICTKKLRAFVLLAHDVAVLLAAVAVTAWIIAGAAQLLHNFVLGGGA